MKQRWNGLVLSFLLVSLCAWLAWSWWSVRRYRRAMAVVDAKMAAGRLGAAARDLERVLATKPGADDAAYLLGICERARGRVEAAHDAWARISPGSDFHRRAILARLRLFHDMGRLADAEQLVTNASADPRADRTDLLILLVPIYSQIGRSDEAGRLIEERWQHLFDHGEATAEHSIELARLHLELTWKASSIDDLRLYFDQVGRGAPDDDRVWLGKAHLAIRTGAFDEARRWLDACRRRRPEDAAVWRGILSLGFAARQADMVDDAVKHLSPSTLTGMEVHRIEAWRAGQGRDFVTQRRALRRLIAHDPLDEKARDQLSGLVEQQGDPSQALESRRRKDEIERLRRRYLALYERAQHVRDAEEMARLAVQLGRRFEARVFLGLASSNEPDRADLRRELDRLAGARLPSSGDTPDAHSLP